MRRAGFSLLEVILAMAILAGAIAVLGEAGRLALRNAGYARDMAQAQLLCESKMAEIVTGIATTRSLAVIVPVNPRNINSTEKFRSPASTTRAFDVVPSG